MYWLSDEWNHPSRSDFYLMQCAREAALVMADSNQRKKIATSDFKLEFRDLVTQQSSNPRNKEDEDQQRDEATRHAKWTHGALLGIAIPHNIKKGEIVQLELFKPKPRGNNGNVSIEEKK